MTKPKQETRKVTFVGDYKTTDGKSVYKGGETYSVPASDARIYLNLGKAAPAAEDTRAHREPTPVTTTDTTAKGGK